MSTPAFNDQFPIHVRKELLDHARNVGLSLRAALADESTYVLGVTSALRGEGKTTFSLALSEVMASDFGLDVLWLDTHAEQPLSTLLASGDLPERGLSEWLTQQCSFEDVIVTVDDRRVLLPFGSCTLTSRDVLQHLVKEDAIHQLRRRYQLILVDLPDLQNPAGAALASLCDGVVLMVRAGDTPLDIVRRLIPILDNVKVHGVILNHHRSAIPTRIRKFFSYYG